MPFQSQTVLNNLIQEALKAQDIVNGLAESGYPQDMLVKKVKEEETEIWNLVQSEVKVYDDTEHRIAEFKSTFPKIYRFLMHEKNYGKPWWAVCLFLLITAFLVFSPFFIGGFYASFVNHYIYNYADGIVLQALLGLAIFGLLQQVTFGRPLVLWNRVSYQIDALYFRLQKRTAEAIKSVTFQNDVEGLPRQKEMIEKRLLEAGIKETMRDILNAHITVSYSTTYNNPETLGLGEVLDTNRTISTVSREQLRFLFNKMPGGSIGIAGSRGAGKTTLLKTFCGPKNIFPELNEKKVLSTLVSAPVKYESRDFILYLFKQACNDLLELEGATLDGWQPLPNNGQIIRRFWPDFVKRLTFLSFLIFFCLALISRTLYVRQEYFHRVPAKPHDTVYVKIINAQKVDSGATAAKVTVASLKKDSVDSLAANHRAPISPSFMIYFFDGINKAGSASFYFNISAISCIIWLTIAFADRRSGRFFGRFRVFIREMDVTFPQSSGLAGQARAWLEKINFQQSYTTGWSGSIKFPFAEGGRNRSKTTSEKPLSNPEIVAGLADFLFKASGKYQVLIGIDEMDKMSSDASAQEFLNEIKSIFGVPGCFFLISVSENAMNNFERRGLPFRDVFDSSFDSIVYVDNFRVEDTFALLQRRVIGRPIAFFCLAHCLAGGLPRDIIRYFREITRIAIKDDHMAAIADRLVTLDIRSKLRAITADLKKFHDLEESENLLEELLKMDSETVNTGNVDRSLEALHTSMVKLKDNVKKLSQASNESGKDSPSLDDKEALLLTTEESFSYLYFITTIRTIFSGIIKEDKLEQEIKAGTFDTIAKSRQLLAVDYNASIKTTNTCRKHFGLRLLTEH
ncbi:hypothetical protein ACCC92_03020 [Mucilaginibacter sp. Mucisp84]|uniref:hypothetical protein n=1 Tax=Mucilaginibacter sp. Mucisp84 TaxID=3243058 RepID=UPI0039A6CB61